MWPELDSTWAPNHRKIPGSQEHGVTLVIIHSILLELHSDNNTQNQTSFAALHFHGNILQSYSNNWTG